MELTDGRNDIAVTSNSYAGDFVTYIISVDRAASTPQLDVPPPPCVACSLTR